MRTIQAADTAVSILITREEAPTGRALLALIRQALTERGLTPWPDAEAECFAAGEDTLVIARPAHTRRPAFYFADLEALLGGALASAAEESALYLAREGGYILVVSAPAAPALYEYGEAFAASSLWEEHAREQGMCLVPERALETLARHFSR